MYAAVAVAATAPAFADDSDEPELRNETITVTDVTADTNPYGDPDAPYRAIRSASGLFTEDLLDTPKTITIITDETLHDLGAKSFRDLFRSQPGITLGTGEGGNAFGDRIFIRGFDARNDVYVDGIRDPGVGSRETFAVQQIEVLKGPSSAFGGRGTTGGAVSLVSKKPGEGDWGDVEFTLGSDATRRATLDVNHEVTDTLTVRLNAMTHDSEVAGRDEVFNNRWGIAAAAEWTPTDALTFSLDTASELLGMTIDPVRRSWIAWCCRVRNRETVEKMPRAIFVTNRMTAAAMLRFPPRRQSRTPSMNRCSGISR
jgi:catecholate siderophore receptor